MPGVNKKPTSKSFNAVTPHRRSARRLCTSAPRPTGSCYGTKPTRGTLDLHHSKYNDTKLTRKSVTYVVELKCYPCEWCAASNSPPPYRRKAQGCGGKDSMEEAHDLVCICYGALYQFPLLCTSVDGIVLRVSCIFGADGANNRASASSSGLRPPFWGLLFDTPTRDAETGKSQGFARSGALGLPGAGHEAYVCFIVDLRGLPRD